MLLAYIDEIGETGAFVSRDDKRFNTSPAFGYAGVLLPSHNARTFGSIFAEEKRRLFQTEIRSAKHPGRWERKGASIFRPDTDVRFPHQIRVFNGLVAHVRRLGGQLFYYANEKPIGTPNQTHLDTEQRETAAMREALNRIARCAESRGLDAMVMIDQINEKTRAARLPVMYGHILGRAGEFPEMKRLVEPPMHVDSLLSANIQFADWVAACVTRAIEYQLIRDARFEWVTRTPRLRNLRGIFTHESKVHLYHRAVEDLHQSSIFNNLRPLYPASDGTSIGERVDPAILRKIMAASERRTQSLMKKQT